MISGCTSFDGGGSLMRALTLSLLLVTAPSVVAAPAPLAKPDRDRRSDALRIQGTWYWHHPSGAVRKIVIGDGYVRWCAGAQNELRETFWLYPTMAPKGIDFREEVGLWESRGIYVLRGGVLIIRDGGRDGARPSSFDGEDGRLFVLQRR
jgi:hypothetical protein